LEISFDQSPSVFFNLSDLWRGTPPCAIVAALPAELAANQVRAMQQTWDDLIGTCAMLASNFDLRNHVKKSAAIGAVLLVAAAALYLAVVAAQLAATARLPRAAALCLASDERRDLMAAGRCAAAWQLLEPVVAAGPPPPAPPLSVAGSALTEITPAAAGRGRFGCVPLLAVFVPSLAFVFFMVVCFLQALLRTYDTNSQTRRLLSLALAAQDIFRLSALFFQAMNGTNTTALFAQAMRNITAVPEFHDIIMETHCFSTTALFCLSYHSLVMFMAQTQPSTRLILTVYLPALYSFGITAIREVLQKEIAEMPQFFFSPYDVFYIFLALLFAALTAITFSAGRALQRSMNALFHFPTELLDEAAAVRTLALPSSVLMVSSLRGTGQIFSITENCQRLLQKPPTAFVFRNLNDVFPATDAALRTYTMPDHRTTKVFRAASYPTANVTKTLLLEEPKEVTPLNDLAQKLALSVPPFFAAKFAGAGLADIGPGAMVFTLVRLAPQLAPPQLEKLYAATNFITKNFSTTRLMRAEGTLVVFGMAATEPTITAFLFLRDLMEEVAKQLRSPPKSVQFPIRSAALFRSDDVLLSIAAAAEPSMAIRGRPFDWMVEETHGIAVRTIAIEKSLFENAHARAWGQNVLIQNIPFLMESFEDFLERFTV
jgi:hypothetical protein